MVRDPACGSGDFLIATFQYADQFGADLRDAVWGADSSENAVDICIVNMILNGDGKGNIRRENSLARIDENLDAFTVMLCNPPFGSRIVERDFEILRKFDLGHEWVEENGHLRKSKKVAKSQELGLLFAELCVRQSMTGGRVGIILPNGYLGNRGARYVAFREWLLRHTRLVAVVGFPRFTFKKSGADVSASVVLVEKRGSPLEAAIETEDYPMYAGILEAVGWSVSDKKAEPQYIRDESTGNYIMDATNERVLDADFGRALADLYSSPIPSVFPWITDGLPPTSFGRSGWSVSIRDIVARRDVSIDPKRWCERAARVREQINALPNFKIGDVAQVVRETSMPSDKEALYDYVELQDTVDGVVTPTRRRGWDLPERARHRADRGDLFVGRIWGSVGKWFLAGGNTSNMVVSNGFHRLRMREGCDDYLGDLVAGLNTEAYRILARSSATGSDGLAELGSADLLEIAIPRVSDQVARTTIEEVLQSLLAGRQSISSVVDGLLREGRISTADVRPRKTNWVQV